MTTAAAAGAATAPAAMSPPSRAASITPIPPGVNGICRNACTPTYTVAKDTKSTLAPTANVANASTAKSATHLATANAAPVFQDPAGIARDASLDDRTKPTSPFAARPNIVLGSAIGRELTVTIAKL